ncbi:GNAT family N-acetyltransferase [Lyngbya confervoides]|uniref:GNAT family N-acetyltransferase n=1 Tax=Lyngbya confervoides BDU141951 TaxID=1574623 RepID=A0ABD4T012_9CYAN|nr:GNAT family N-acetyltransferase [Lyngbya confervoides]MCM1981863.1 GNAT family N-acetyltransferase [Lyngbya confervoides BDU141951]
MASLTIKTCLFVAEAQSISGIRHRVFGQEQGIDPALDWDGKDSEAVHVLASLDRQPVGVARLREIGPRRLKLERLAVLPDYRQQGIGSELVYTAIAYGRQQGYVEIVLHAQSPTVPFYDRLGFHPVGEIFHEAGLEHQAMSLHLVSDTSP